MSNFNLDRPKMNLGLKQRVWQVPQVQQAVVLRLKTGKLRRLNEMIGVRKNIVNSSVCIPFLNLQCMFSDYFLIFLQAREMKRRQQIKKTTKRMRKKMTKLLPKKRRRKSL